MYFDAGCTEKQLKMVQTANRSVVAGRCCLVSVKGGVPLPMPVGFFPWTALEILLLG